MKKMKLAAIFAGLVSVFTFSSCLNDGDSGFGLAAIVLFVGFICCVDYDAEDIIKFLKKPLIIGLIVGTIGIFVPSENTCYKMLAASLITPDNIEVVKDGTQELVDYIIDVADQITENDDDDK